MNETGNQAHEAHTQNHLARRLGFILVVFGVIVLVDQQLKTGWLTLLIVPAIGLSFLISGLRARRLLLISPGMLVTAFGVAAVILFGPRTNLGWQQQVGYLLAAITVGAAFTLLAGQMLFHRMLWWAFFVGAGFLAMALTFLLTPLRLTDFALYGLTGIGLSLLAWGAGARLMGLIIPGCLLLGIGPGIYLAWSGVSEPNSLARTGIMLVTFALGWGLIILFSRVITTGFVWWPLIPGGILAMVGWGLYIGGNPENAASFIGNTGSIGLIIFGIYLMLLRRGIKN